MKKNTKVAIEKKLETAGKSKKDKTKLLTANVRMRVHKLEQMTPNAGRKLEAVVTTPKPVKFYIGIDLGDKKSNYCIMNAGAEIRAEDKLATTREEFGAYFPVIPRSRIALEAGTHSPWVSDLPEGLGHEVYVANPRKMESIK
jgi:hypothetical protein